MTENKRYSFNWERGHPNFWDNYCDLADCYLTCEDVCEVLNELNDENKKLRQRITDYADICACSIQVMNEDEKLKKDYSSILCKRMYEIIEENKEFKDKIKKLEKENKQLNHQNELLSDESEQCKAVIDNRWSEYLQKKELSE